MRKQRRYAIERILGGINERIEAWRRRDAARKAAVDADRDELWAEARAEAVEREWLLAEAIGEEEAWRASAGEITEPRRVFVVHSGEASRALGSFARERRRLVSVVPGADVKGSWLVFKASE